MVRYWNVLGWLAIVTVLPGMIYATVGESDSGAPNPAHAAHCKTCLSCKGQRLPDVIDGNNLRVISPSAVLSKTQPTPEKTNPLTTPAHTRPRHARG